MKQQLFISIAILFLPVANLFAQQKDPVLFELGDQQVHVSEFLYIYNKNNGQEADYSRKSLEEYLDLYIKFKMKVARARELQLDTIQELATELAGYRRQLANSYLTDKEVIERLSMELYERQKDDVSISHILVACDPSVTGDDTLGYFRKAMRIHDQLDKGVPFDTLAKKYSEDTYSAPNGGALGYLTAKLPDGFYQVETAAYNTPVGKYSMPVRSRLGYHIVKVTDRRPARGELEVAHILARKARKDQPDKLAEAKIRRIYDQLKGGGDFDVLAKANSEDNNTSKNGGYIGFFGINQFESSFEEAAFALQEDGSYTEPVESSIGWHIIKRISKKPVLPYDRVRRKLQEEIKKDERFGLAERAMIRRIKTQGDFKENTAVLDSFTNTLDQSFYSVNWRAPFEIGNDTLFTLGNEVTYLKEFTDFARNNTRTRLRLSKETPLKTAVDELYGEFVDGKCIKYEEANLERNYPDFRALMREYEEGILLFEATKIHVWDKAAKDSIGLQTFFEANRDRYQWDERAEVLDITIKTTNEKLAQKISKYIRSKGVDKAVAKFNKKEPIVSFVRKMAEKKARKDYEPLEFAAGESTPMEMKDGHYTYKYIARIHAPALKTMDEARGYIIADYQDELEKQWIAELKKTYPVRLDQKVFDSLIR